MDSKARKRWQTPAGGALMAAMLGLREMTDADRETLRGIVAAGQPGVAQDADRWITAHPNSSGPGSPVKIGEGGEVLAGMGGKFNGKHIGAVGRGKGEGEGEAPSPGASAPKPEPNGSKFSGFVHGTAVPFDRFDAGRFGKSGGGYNHQGKGVYLTDDRHGYARFFANAAASAYSFRRTDVPQAERDEVENHGGSILDVHIKPEAKILDARKDKIPPEIQALLSKDVAAGEGHKLQEAVVAAGYDGIAFHEPNYPEGWELKKDATTVVVYNPDVLSIKGHMHGEAARKPGFSEAPQDDGLGTA